MELKQLLNVTIPKKNLPLGLSLLCSNIVLLFCSGILPCYCCYFQTSLAIMLILCSFHNWENTSNLKREELPSNWHLSLTTLHHRCCHWWSERYCPDAGCRFSKFSQLTLPNLFAAMWQICPCILPLFRHNAQMLLACNYSYIMLSIIDSSLPVRHVYIYWCKLIPLPACTELLSTWHMFSQYLNRAVTLALDYWVLNNSRLSD